MARSPQTSGILLFLPVLCAWVYLVCFVTTNDPFFDNTIGCNATNLLFVSFQLLVVEPCPTSFGIWQRMSLAWKIRTSPRSPWRAAQAAGRTQNTRRQPLERVQGRSAFIKSGLVLLALNLLCLDAINDISRFNQPTSHSSLVSKLSGLLLPAWVYCGLNCIYYPWSIASVGLQKSQPDDWPYLFDLEPLTKETWSIRLFWGRVWHQIMRGHLSANSRFITRKILRLSVRSQYTRDLEVFLGFFLSGFMHAVGESMACQKPSFGSLAFFMLQPVAMLFERWIGRALVGQVPCGVARLAGIVWVILWFTLTLPIWTEPLRTSGFMTAPSNIPRGTVRAALSFLVSRSMSGSNVYSH
ncbi:membrane bound O-acyl transferase family-domain-containing protein [Coprinopsis sp. MPI-PUGE-AT-0042]|nr:membrane bound O-acyl transferase family-domain-containing protein [Coprinopsis sp. MPI-PUGE-AT-0042]